MSSFAPREPGGDTCADVIPSLVPEALLGVHHHGILLYLFKEALQIIARSWDCDIVNPVVTPF